ncbi:hypothetical protein R3P38DRAFT_2797856 [Favolaschia claudopus]|uniref:Uncharacterized protein n=1 Tax=Favolaschia claudopus TaxID=2862362 RepID=A0AAW0A1U6_9AGAR
MTEKSIAAFQEFAKLAGFPVLEGMENIYNSSLWFEAVRKPPGATGSYWVAPQACSGSGSCCPKTVPLNLHLIPLVREHVRAQEYTALEPPEPPPDYDVSVEPLVPHAGGHGAILVASDSFRRASIIGIHAATTSCRQQRGIPLQFTESEPKDQNSRLRTQKRKERVLSLYHQIMMYYETYCTKPTVNFIVPDLEAFAIQHSSGIYVRVPEGLVKFRKLSADDETVLEEDIMRVLARTPLSNTHKSDFTLDGAYYQLRKDYYEEILKLKTDLLMVQDNLHNIEEKFNEGLQSMETESNKGRSAEQHWNDQKTELLQEIEQVNLKITELESKNAEIEQAYSNLESKFQQSEVSLLKAENSEDHLLAELDRVTETMKVQQGVLEETSSNLIAEQKKTATQNEIVEASQKRETLNETHIMELEQKIESMEITQKDLKAENVSVLKTNGMLALQIVGERAKIESLQQENERLMKEPPVLTDDQANIDFNMPDDSLETQWKTDSIHSTYRNSTFAAETEISDLKILLKTQEHQLSICTIRLFNVSDFHFKRKVLAQEKQALQHRNHTLEQQMQDFVVTFALFANANTFSRHRILRLTQCLNTESEDVIQLKRRLRSTQEKTDAYVAILQTAEKEKKTFHILHDHLMDLYKKAEVERNSLESTVQDLKNCLSTTQAHVDSVQKSKTTAENTITSLLRNQAGLQEKISALEVKDLDTQESLKKHFIQHESTEKVLRNLVSEAQNEILLLRQKLATIKVLFSYNSHVLDDCYQPLRIEALSLGQEGELRILGVESELEVEGLRVDYALRKVEAQHDVAVAYKNIEVVVGEEADAGNDNRGERRETETRISPLSKLDKLALAAYDENESPVPFSTLIGRHSVLADKVGRFCQFQHVVSATRYCEYAPGESGGQVTVTGIGASGKKTLSEDGSKDKRVSYHEDSDMKPPLTSTKIGVEYRKEAEELGALGTETSSVFAQGKESRYILENLHQPRLDLDKVIIGAPLLIRNINSPQPHNDNADTITFPCAPDVLYETKPRKDLKKKEGQLAESRQGWYYASLTNEVEQYNTTGEDSSAKILQSATRNQSREMVVTEIGPLTLTRAVSQTNGRLTWVPTAVTLALDHWSVVLVSANVWTTQSADLACNRREDSAASLGWKREGIGTCGGAQGCRHAGARDTQLTFVSLKSFCGGR